MQARSRSHCQWKSHSVLLAVGLSACVSVNVMCVWCLCVRRYDEFGRLKKQFRGGMDRAAREAAALARLHGVTGGAKSIVIDVDPTTLPASKGGASDSRAADKASAAGSHSASAPSAPAAPAGGSRDRERDRDRGGRGGRDDRDRDRDRDYRGGRDDRDRGRGDRDR